MEHKEGLMKVCVQLELISTHTAVLLTDGTDGSVREALQQTASFIFYKILNVVFLK